MTRTFGLLSVFFAVACNNPCQSLCETLADYAADDCGTPFTASDLDACIDDWAKAEASDRKTCSEFGTPERVRREWTCDDLNLYRHTSQNTETSDNPA